MRSLFLSWVLHYTQRWREYCRKEIFCRRHVSRSNFRQCTGSQGAVPYTCATKELTTYYIKCWIYHNFWKHFVCQISMKGHSKWFITKSIGIVPELFASRMLFVCFTLIFTTSHDIDTTDIFSVNFNGMVLDTNRWTLQWEQFIWTSGQGRIKTMNIK